MFTRQVRYMATAVCRSPTSIIVRPSSICASRCTTYTRGPGEVSPAKGVWWCPGVLDGDGGCGVAPC